MGCWDIEFVPLELEMLPKLGMLLKGKVDGLPRKTSMRKGKGKSG